MSSRLAFTLTTATAPWTEGDRISLPAHILESLGTNAHDDEASRVLTFNVMFPSTGQSLACGVKDFAADADVVLAPAWILSALGAADGDTVEVRIVDLPKATAVKLRATDLTYLELPDIRAVLESALRDHFTCINRGMPLRVRAFLPGEHVMATCSFVVADLTPRVNACTVINTDVEVDLAPLEADPVKLHAMHAEWKRHRADLAPKPLPTTAGQHHRVTLDPGQAASFAVEMKAVPETHGVVRVAAEVGEGDCNLYAHPLLRASLQDNTALDVTVGSKAVEMDVAPARAADAAQVFVTIEVDGDAPCVVDLVWTSSEASSDPSSGAANGSDAMAVDDEPDEGPYGHTKCPTCQKWISAGAYPLHQIHCARNTVACSTCGAVLLRTRAKDHWHCPEPRCTFVALHPGEPDKHLRFWHTPTACSGCDATFSNAAGTLQTHRRAHCPARIIYCRYCHTYAPAGPSDDGLSAADRLAGLTSAHEAACAARTVDCRTCGRPVARRDVAVHMQLHAAAKRNQPKPLTLCRNWVCGRPVVGTPAPGAICLTCFAPFYSSRAASPREEAAALVRKRVQRYFQQATVGCGHAWCGNKYCCSSPKFEWTDLDATGKAIQCMQLAKAAPVDGMWLCVASQRIQDRRSMAQDLAAAHGWDVEWCLEALIKTEQDDETDASDDDDDAGGANDDRQDVQAQVRWMSRAVDWLLKLAPPPKAAS
ncbi:hypothetical protein AMAG_02126 [Allomyces macrogynus ATCC 38327]|uniref:Uncharacterized protein n=1 Tax=Allomyces macrogynus (strain ATCC 38327) TaxID=578462 RepID=A0A0L0S135_ALLM3|nr:hypothetical protein AMAG_02126 [Allomyces macrogynus ATCC 38327]|eukprot:KNE56302.1 hypothetical protein AMAG_02126 [Allomyces macrogynus ATCC 38327]